MVMDTIATKQYALDLLVASSDRNYTDKTKKRYDIDMATREANWAHEVPVEGLMVTNYPTFHSSGEYLFLPANQLTEEQRQYFDLSKGNGSQTITVKHKKYKTK